MIVLSHSMDEAEQLLFGLFPDMLPPVRVVTRESDLLLFGVRAATVLSLRIPGWNPALEAAARRAGAEVWVVFPPAAVLAAAV